MWAPEFLAGRACPSAGRAVEATGAREYGDRHDVRYADEERRTSNAQLSTFNGVTERAQGGGIWGQTRLFGTGDANRGTGTMSGIPIRNVQSETFNSQLLTG